MSFEIYQKRNPSVKDTTFSQLWLPGHTERFCYILEDKIREIPGVPVEQWKIPGKTAIPAGRYRVTLEKSTKFGPDTITLNNVPGYTTIRVHAGNDDDHTEGCPITGLDIDLDPNGDGGNIRGGTSKPALEKLKAVLVPLLKSGTTEVFWNVVNP